MLGNFYNAFKNDSDYILPKSVQDIISKEIPEGYGYVYSKQLKRYVAAPINKDEKQQLDISFDRSQIAVFPSWAKENPNTIMEYLYRTQKRIRLSNAVLKGKDGKIYPLSVLQKDPFSSQEKSVEEFILPSPFPKGKEVTFETESGKQRIITIRRVPCDSREYIKMSNIDFPALNLQAYIPDIGCKDHGKMSISVTPNKAESVIDAVFSLELLKGYVEGTLKINGISIGKILADVPNYNSNTINERIVFWNNILSLQKTLGVKFNPQIPMDSRDFQIYSELATMFVDGKDVRYSAPVEYITVNKEAIEDAEFKKVAINESNGLAMSYINGPVKTTLLGAEFELYTTDLMFGFKIDRVEDDGEMARLYFVNYGKEPWKLIKRCSLSREQAALEQKRMQDTYLSASKQ